MRFPFSTNVYVPMLRAMRYLSLASWDAVQRAREESIEVTTWRTYIGSWLYATVSGKKMDGGVVRLSSTPPTSTYTSCTSS